MTNKRFYKLLQILVLTGALFASTFDVSAEDFKTTFEIQSYSLFSSSLKNNPSDLNPNRFHKSVEGESQIEFSIPLKNGVKNYSFEAYDIRAKQYQSLRITDNGSVKDTTAVAMFRNSDNNGNYARLNYARDASGEEKLIGFLKEGDDYYSVETSKTDSNLIEVKELLKEDVADLLKTCGVDGSHQLALQILAVPGEQTTENKIPFAKKVLREFDVATEADYSYFQSIGNSASFGNSEILANISAVDAIYREHLGVTLKVVHQHIWETQDPYDETDAFKLLHNYRNIQLGLNQPDYDIGVMFTGRVLNNGAVGIAFIASACHFEKYGFAIVQNVPDKGTLALATAHELGHTLGASENFTCASNPGFIMCQKNRNRGEEFSPPTLNLINSYIASQSCYEEIEEDTTGPTQPLAPTLSEIGNRTVNETSTLSFNVNATDPNGETLTFRANNLPSGATFTNKRFSWTPSYNVVSGQGSKNFNIVFSVQNESGLTDSKTVSVVVNNRNRYPLIGQLSLADLTITEGAKLVKRIWASDADKDSIVFSGSNFPQGASISQSGILTWTPNKTQAGTYTLKIIAKDPFNSSDVGDLKITVRNNSNLDSKSDKKTYTDFDGDGKDDLGLYQTKSGAWSFNSSKQNLAASQLKFGGGQRIPVPGNFDGDNISDLAFYTPASGNWGVRLGATGRVFIVPFGDATSLPALADYDGDGKSDYAVYSPLTGIYKYKSSINSSIVQRRFGKPGDIPVPCDFDGDGLDDITLYDSTTGVWTSYYSSGQQQQKRYGIVGDIPIPGDYKGDQKCEYAVYRPSNGTWYILGYAPETFGARSDIPVRQDIDGDGKLELVVYRSTSGDWFLKHSNGQVVTKKVNSASDFPIAEFAKYYAMRNSSGFKGDSLSSNHTNFSIFNRTSQTISKFSSTGQVDKTLRAAAGTSILRTDFNGDGRFEDAVFNSGVWNITDHAGYTAVFYWGLAGDIPMSADFDGDGRTDLAIWRPLDGGWYIINSSDGQFRFYQWGLAGDIPMPADYNGDGWADLAVWRPSGGYWFVFDGRSGQAMDQLQWGLWGDIPLASDLDRDGRADKIVFRPSNGTWYWQASGNNNQIQTLAWGLPGDFPVTGRFQSPTLTDIAVFRPSDGNLYIRSLAGEVKIFSTPHRGGRGNLVQSSPVWPVN